MRRLVALRWRKRLGSVQIGGQPGLQDLDGPRGPTGRPDQRAEDDIAGFGEKCAGGKVS
jgi:hypothetical protein